MEHWQVPDPLATADSVVRRSTSPKSATGPWRISWNPTPGDFACPVKVFAADPAVRSPFGPSGDLGTLAGIDYDFVPGTGHFLQLEKPRECVEAMVAFLEPLGLS